MNLYECMFLVDSGTAANDWDGIVSYIHGILTKHNSEIIKTQKFGERKLAYKIGDYTRGAYILVNFNAPTGSIVLMRREFELSDKVIRLLIVRNDEPKKKIPVKVSVATQNLAEAGDGNKTEEIVEHNLERSGI